MYKKLHTVCYDYVSSLVVILIPYGSITGVLKSFLELLTLLKYCYKQLRQTIFGVVICKMKNE